MVGRRSFRFATGSPSGNREVLHVTRLIRILLAGLAVLVALELAPAAAGPVPAADVDLHVLGAATTTTTTTTTTTVPTSPGFSATLSGTYDCSTGEITLTLRANRRSIPVAVGTVTVERTVAIVNGLLVPLSPGFEPVDLDFDFSTSGVVTAVDANPNVIVVRYRVDVMRPSGDWQSIPDSASTAVSIDNSPCEPATTTTTTTTLPSFPGIFATLSGTYDCSTGEITLTLRGNPRSIGLGPATVNVLNTFAIVNGLLVPLSPGFESPVPLDVHFSTSGVVDAVDVNPNDIVVQYRVDVQRPFGGPPQSIHDSASTPVSIDNSQCPTAPTTTTSTTTTTTSRRRRRHRRRPPRRLSRRRRPVHHDNHDDRADDHDHDHVDHARPRRPTPTTTTTTTTTTTEPPTTTHVDHRPRRPSRRRPRRRPRPPRPRRPRPTTTTTTEPPTTTTTTTTTYADHDDHDDHDDRAADHDDRAADDHDDLPPPTTAVQPSAATTQPPAHTTGPVPTTGCIDGEALGFRSTARAPCPAGTVPTTTPAGTDTPTPTASVGPDSGGSPPAPSGQLPRTAAPTTRFR